MPVAQAVYINYLYNAMQELILVEGIPWFLPCYRAHDRGFWNQDYKISAVYVPLVV